MLLRNIRAKSQPFVTKIIIDTHGGLQDVIAIMHSIKFAKHNKMQIIGITVTNGRRTLEEATTDALLAVTLAGAEIPIYKGKLLFYQNVGSKQAMMLNRTYPKCINYSQDHDILQEMKKNIPQESKKLIQTVQAAKFLADKSRQLQRQLGILCFGPLTNIAVASHLGKQIRQLGVVCMSGGQHSATGNVIGKHSQQGNFSYDPESAYLVLKTFRKNERQSNLYVTPIETSLTFDFKEAGLKFLQEYDSKLSPQVKQLHEYWIHFNKQYTLNSSLLTSLILFYPRSLKRFYQVYAEVCIEGKQIKGLLAIDWLRMEVNHGERPENVRLAYEVDKDDVRVHMLESWEK